MNYPKPDLDFLCVMLGGSHCYDLAHENSDRDYRGVYLNSLKREVVGLAENENYAGSEPDDYQYFSLVKFMKLLQKTNTNTIEILFSPEYLFITDDFRIIKDNRQQFINSARLISSCKGYLFTEARLALGERTGRLGGKRKAEIDKWNFSAKNVASILRIVSTLKGFLQTGEWNCVVSGDLKTLSMDLKLHPEKFSISDVKELIGAAQKEAESFVDTLGWTFNTDLAAEIIWDIYKRKF